ncbi:cytochrome P450 [Zopfia rhizophila CBS 207.26]|uniref:Cytochrome P450 n=1 Tax=Zopfia rhizophila CBS 207.26 TaxID=1314779 RepID=A0A6A6E4K3_9PEZI|nr:cytochrome P450 [Zopfia rhizophila CBS 207.26]
MPRYDPITGHFSVLRQHISRLPPNCIFNSAFFKVAEDFPEGFFYFDLWPLFNPILFVNTIPGVLQMTQASLERPKEVNVTFDTFVGGQNLISMPEAPWKYWRNLFNPGFRERYIQDLVPKVTAEVDVFCRILRQCAARGGIVKLDDLTFKLTVDVINATVMDTRLHHQERDHPFAESLRFQLEWTALDISLLKQLNPLRPLFIWYNDKKLSQFVNSEIEKRFQELQSANDPAPGSTTSTNSPKSIISLALEKYIQEKGGDVQRLDPEFRDIAARQVRLLLFAGHDTTSSTLVYCYHLLATNPEALSCIRAEHDEVFGTDTSTTLETLIQNPGYLNRLPYTLAVIKESLRLFPPASNIRAGRPSFNITGENGKIYPTAGCNIWCPHDLLQRNPKYWVRPNEFVPERWLVGEGDPLYPPKGAWRPFEFGPKQCLGQTLAKMEMKMVLAATVRDFDVKPAYEELDELKGVKKDAVRTFLGERAYQASYGGNPHACEKYPCRISLRE